jgi:hypothetical protein
MAVVVSKGAQTLADILNQRFGLESKKIYGTFAVEPGKRYDKIVVTPKGSSQTFVHAFVECATGHVFKPQGWKSPAKGVRFMDAAEAGNAADPYGRYLYARR